MRVLSIAHNAVAASNRARAEALACLPGVDATLLTPPWWFEEGRRIEAPRIAANGARQRVPWRVGRTLFTGNGTRHVYVSGLVEAIRALKPDVIDLYEEPFSVVALQTLMLRNALAPRSAMVFYSAVNVERRWRLPYRLIERLVLRAADGAHAPNQDVPRILRARGFSSQPVSVIPLGVDPQRFERAAAVELSGVPAPRIGFVGRLEPVKGLDVLLDALERIKTPASLVIAGDGSERTRLAARLKSERVHLVAPVSYEHMPGFLKGLDLLVVPSVTIPPVHREQFGRVLVEAMAAGVAVIGSDSGAIPDVIGDAGLVVPERDADAFATAIDRLLAEPALRASLVARGRQRVQSHFTWSIIADQTLELFRSAVAHRQRVTANLRAVRA